MNKIFLRRRVTARKHIYHFARGTLSFKASPLLKQSTGSFWNSPLAKSRIMECFAVCDENLVCREFLVRFPIMHERVTLAATRRLPLESASLLKKA